MPLTVRHPPYIIPEYSLTGDLLAYLNCPRQYRYYNKAALPPARPVQLWFGEFIHGVLHEAFLRWRDQQAYKRFPWDWATHLRPIEMEVYNRLAARALYPPPNLFCPYTQPRNNPGWCDDDNHPHRLLASERAFAMVNTWGQHLLPMIAEAEVKLTGSRAMPQGIPNPRSNYYSITGIVDVISSVNLANAPRGNLLVHRLQELPALQAQMGPHHPQFDVIIDYKGMRRPATNSDTWNHHEWQLKTYGWLRQNQQGPRSIAAAIVFYINELEPSLGDKEALIEEVRLRTTDVLPSLSSDVHALSGNVRPRNISLSSGYMEQRALRIIPISDQTIQQGLTEFDTVVGQIEGAVAQEITGQPLQTCWTARPEVRTCTACDFKTYCPQAAPRQYAPTVP